MKTEFKNDILNREGHPDGMTVPEGYFDNFAAMMESKLPVNDLEKRPSEALKPLTAWKRLRPYIYMAAMFAGVWCMMKMFSMVNNAGSDFNLDQNPTIAAALSNEDFVSDYVISDYSSTPQLLDDLYSEGFSVNDLSF